MAFATNLNTFKLKGSYDINYQNTGYDVYKTNTLFPITVILSSNLKPVTNSNNIQILDRVLGYPLWLTFLSVVEYWADVIGQTNATLCLEPAMLSVLDKDSQVTQIVNPLKGTSHKGLTIYAGVTDNTTDGLGMSQINFTRSRYTDLQTDTYLLPYNACVYFNSVLLTPAGIPLNKINKTSTFNVPFNNVVNDITARDTYWYMIAHQVAHVLGFGTLWYVRDVYGKLIRSFMVGAGDGAANRYFEPRLNLFYSTQSVNPDFNRSAASDVRVPVKDGRKVGDARYVDALNLNSTKKTFLSKAVQNYNTIFKTSLSAIPVENGDDPELIGTHWDEGVNINAPQLGTERQYYGKPCNSLHDELMTPKTEIYRKSPVSIVTLGALEDLGWKVDYTKSEIYDPYNIYIHSTNLKSYWVTASVYGQDTKILVYNPNVTTIEPGNPYTDWLTDSTINPYTSNKPNIDQYRYINDRNNTYLLMRKGFTYTLHCQGTVMNKDATNAMLIARNRSLSINTTRIFDVVDEMNNVIFIPTIQDDGISTIVMKIPTTGLLRQMLWLRVGIKDDLAKLNTNIYNNDKNNFTFRRVAPIYIYG